MAKFTWSGMDAFERKLSRLGSRSTAAARRAVSVAAGIVADEIRRGIEGLDTAPDWQGLTGWQKGEPVKILESQKKGLLDGLGIAAFRDDIGYINTRVGFNGYNGIKTRAWPKGQPNALIARSCERGSVAMIRQPFVAPAVKRARQRAEAEMERVLDDEIRKIIIMK